MTAIEKTVEKFVIHIEKTKLGKIKTHRTLKIRETRKMPNKLCSEFACMGGRKMKIKG